MNAPLIWIAFPLAVSVLLYFLQRRRLLVILLGGIVSFGLAAMALLIPIASLIKIGPLSFQISSTLEILGRRFLLDNGNRPFLELIYITGGFWFLGAWVARTSRLFVPLGLSMMALLVAVGAVEPFLYAALLIEMAVLVSMPMLAPPGKPFSQGLLRYLIFQTLALPFILFAGWGLAAIEANPSDLRLYPQVEVFLGLGFAFWLAVFPFYTWIPLLAEESHPYVAGFVLMMLSSVILLLPLNFLDSFAWLRTSQVLFPGLRLTGLLMVGTGGVWAAFQSNPARLMGYAVIVETGFSLLALSLGIPNGLSLYTQLLVPRIVAIALWALALSIWQRQAGFQGFDHSQGLLRRSPIVCGAFLVAYFSLGGLPLLAGFPPRQVLMETLASQSLSISFWVLVGNVGFLIGGLRALMAMVNTPEPWQRIETLAQSVMLAAGALALIVLGVFPGWFLPGMIRLLEPFTHLK